MNAPTRRRIRRWALASAGITAAGVVVGYYKAAFFLPGWTAHRLRQIDLGGAA